MAKVKNNYKNYKRWLNKSEKNRQTHRTYNAHYKRLKSGWYTRLPLLIAQLEYNLKYRGVMGKGITYNNWWYREKRHYYDKLPNKIERYKRIYEDYLMGKIPGIK